MDRQSNCILYYWKTLEDDRLPLSCCHKPNYWRQDYLCIYFVKDRQDHWWFVGAIIWVFWCNWSWRLARWWRDSSPVFWHRVVFEYWSCSSGIRWGFVLIIRVISWGFKFASWGTGAAVRWIVRNCRVWGWREDLNKVQHCTMHLFIALILIGGWSPTIAYCFIANLICFSDCSPAQ